MTGPPVHFLSVFSGAITAFAIGGVQGFSNLFAPPYYASPEKRGII
jgi:hypothetical protein